MLKKYIDDVFTYGYAFGSKAVLKGRELLIATSTGSPELAYQPGAHNQYAVSQLLLPFQQTANLCGLTYLTPFVFYNVNASTDEQIKESAPRFVEYIHDEKLSDVWRVAKF
jgi:putative NADPH-quinone reductase